MSLMLNYDLQQAIPSLDSISGPGSFAFLDNLAVGLPSNVPHQGDTGLTLDDARTHFSIWSIMASPLVLNHNIFPGPKAVDPALTKLITNKEVIAVNQDPLGKSAVRIDGARTWQTLTHRTPFQPDAWAYGEQLAKPLANGDIAVLLFNRNNATMDIILDFQDVNDTSRRCWKVRDLWRGADLGRQNFTFVAKDVPPHGCRLLRLSAGELCEPEPPPPPPAVPCPMGYTHHAPGFWQNVEACRSASNCTACPPSPHSNWSTCRRDQPSSLAACAERCRAVPNCVAFELYTVPSSDQACYVFREAMDAPFQPCADCVTCVKAHHD